jgi:hypothetical protein
MRHRRKVKDRISVQLRMAEALAHRAIGRLMASGHVRVVVTNNFGQLLEQALADQDVKAAVISSSDQIAGAHRY